MPEFDPKKFLSMIPPLPDTVAQMPPVHPALSYDAAAVYVVDAIISHWERHLASGAPPEHFTAFLHVLKQLFLERSA